MTLILAKIAFPGFLLDAVLESTKSPASLQVLQSPSKAVVLNIDVCFSMAYAVQYKLHVALSKKQPERKQNRNRSKYKR